MLKKILLSLIITILIIFAFSIEKISNTQKENLNQKTQTINKTDYPQEKNILSIKDSNKKNIENKNEKAHIIGSLIINKINLNENLYEINSSENSVEKHVTILKESIFPDEKNSILFIAAHSGTGNIAYFEELDKLKEDDEITIILKNKTYTYRVKNIWEKEKNGYINVRKENIDQLILTTCSPSKKNYQLIINCLRVDNKK